MKFIVLFFLGLVLHFAQSQAHAHKVTGSLWTDGPVIEGEIGFSNGSYALEGTLVQVFDNNENLLGETKIIEEGLFRYQPAQKIDHIFKADLSAGHVAILKMTADEVPVDGPVSDKPIKKSSNLEASQSNVSSPNNDELSQLVAKAVRKEVQPLRKEIAAYKEKNDMQAILGGIGYILGLTGIAFFVMAKRQKEKDGA